MAATVDQIQLENNKKVLRLVKGDITERTVDVIVNASNSYLKHGGGVAAAIVRKGGKIIQEESDKIGFVPVGSSVITIAGRLPCKAVIHTVGPRMGEGSPLPLPGFSSGEGSGSNIGPGASEGGQGEADGANGDEGADSPEN